MKLFELFDLADQCNMIGGTINVLQGGRACEVTSVGVLDRNLVIEIQRPAASAVNGVRPRKNAVVLTPVQRQRAQAMRENAPTIHKKNRALVLMLADESTGERLKDKEIAERAGTTVTTVQNIRKHWLARQNVDAVIWPRSKTPPLI